MQYGFFTLILGFIAFMALGLPDGLVGIAWPFMKDDFNQPLSGVGTLIFAGTLGAALSGVFSSWAVRKLGIGKLLALSCLFTAVALFGYGLTDSWIIAIVCAVISGIAAGVTDASVNGHVARLYSDRMMQWLHASYGIGITLGSFMMTMVMVFSEQWQQGYQLQGGAQFLLAIVFLIFARAWIIKSSIKTNHQEQVETQHATMAQSLASIQIWFSMGLFFIYTALEVSVGLWGFTLLTESRQISTALAGSWIAIYWGMFTVGRIVFGLAASKFNPNQTMLFSFILSTIGIALFVYPSTGQVNLVSLIIIGFAYAPMFPALVSGTLQRVGEEHFNNAMGLQITAASLGIALLPGLVGLIANATSLETIPWMLLIITLVMIVIYLTVPAPTTASNMTEKRTEL